MTEGLARVKAALEGTLQSSHDRAWTMHADFYTAPDLLALEVEHLFKKEWHCVGRVEKLAGPGQFMPYRLAKEPMVITHGCDGVIRT
ncbi:MAG: hypothetical protein GDA49_09195 [Rhodospirillales bacterium]|nr:hypothetical protein [Rhodospirillales bacterium]